MDKTYEIEATITYEAYQSAAFPRETTATKVFVVDAGSRLEAQGKIYERLEHRYGTRLVEVRF